jgi:hypothetical protein
MKFSVTPESNRAMALALFDLVCRKVRRVMDFLFDINTFEVWVCLISADLIKQVENPVTIPLRLSRIHDLL